MKQSMLACGLIGLAVTSAWGEPEGKEGTRQPRTIADLPANLRVGVRSEFLRQKIPAIPTVVLVPDTASYVEAIAGWGLRGRYPVLIDDGTWGTRQRIAQFVRAFEPERVVRWEAGEQRGAWPADAAERRRRIEGALASAWDAPEGVSIAEHWKSLQFVPPGVVVSSAEDAAWPAALALAAGRGQPLVWTATPAGGGPDGMLSAQQADELAKLVADAAAKTGYAWDQIGDELDAVTLCLSCPAKVLLPESDKRSMLALTDLVGRSVGGERGRWAWCGQIFGGEARGAWDAMSALFLRPERAWLFDGYDNSEPWNNWDATAAAVPLEKVGVATTVDDDMGGLGAADWARRAAGTAPDGEKEGGSFGVEAGLVTVTTSGMSDFFDLKPGRCKPADVPVLRIPAAVYFVHSWSANEPTNRRTIAGRWRERGAYAYVGSVHEPYLQAFVPTPAMTARLAGGMCWGVATRMDAGEPWKVAVLGDPLLTLGLSGAGAKAEAPLPLEGAASLQDAVAAAVRAKEFPKALTELSLSGRDRDAVRLLAALIKDDPAALTPETGLAGLSAAYFQGDLATFLAAYRAALPRLEDEKAVQEQGLGETRDMLWHALWPRQGSLSPEEAELLGRSLRPEVLVRDAAEAHAAVLKASGREAAGAVVTRALKLAPDDATRAELGRIGG